jgi:hypothetical protein
VLTKLSWKCGVLSAILAIFCGGAISDAAAQETAVLFAGSGLQSQRVEPQWIPYVLGPRELREEIRSLPMEQRPYRPMHFYGNTIRREYYRGSPAPLPRDIFEASNSLFRPRSASPLTPRILSRR